MVDLIEKVNNAIVLVNVVERDKTQISFHSNLKTDEVCQRVILISDLRVWLSSFDTASATECFTAVNILKMKIAQEEKHEADERLLNSDWGEMEVQE